ncbi:Dihydropteroate synthase-like protein, partial [Baffinella frigidus]
MGVLNYTPDSFSDGGRFNAGIDEAVKRIEDMAAAGADIVDIGGQSTRPNAKLVTSEEEAARVVPVIEAARARGCTVAISVDTFRADVARASVAAGANFVNDVSGGLLDPAMLSTVASLHVPVCLMHYRGDPSSM